MAVKNKLTRNKMYCPVCYGESLKLSSSGVVTLAINGKQMDTGRFLYNLAEDGTDVLLQRLQEKIDQFFKWYMTFQNRHPITEIQLTTTTGVCAKGCKIPAGNKYSVIGVVYKEKEIKKILEDLGKKYSIAVNVKF